MDATQETPDGANTATKTLSPADAASSASPIPQIQPLLPADNEDLYDTGDEYYKDPEFWCPRIDRLCKSTWPEATCEISFLKKGKDHTLFALCIKHHDVSLAEDYILALPEDDSTVESEAKVLQYLAGRIERFQYMFAFLKVPEVVQWDATKDNELKYPYIMNKRLPGTKLGKSWDTFAFHQKIAIATEVGRIYGNLMLMKNDDPGIRSSLVGNGTSHTGGTASRQHQDKFSVFYKRFANNSNTMYNTVDLSGSGLSVGSFILSSMRTTLESMNRYAETVSSSNGYSCRHTLYDVLDEIEQRRQFGVFSASPEKSCLFHANFSLDNILFDFSPTGRPRVTGVIGWEEPLFGPLLMAAKPPRWLWRSQESKALEPTYGIQDDLEPLETTLVEADSLNNEHIKEAFERGAGEEWVDMAYDEDFVLVRRGLMLCMEGKHWGAKHFCQCEDIIRAWQEICGDQWKSELNHGASCQTH